MHSFVISHANDSNERTATRGAAGAYAAGVQRVSGTLDCFVGALIDHFWAHQSLSSQSLNSGFPRSDTEVLIVFAMWS